MRTHCRRECARRIDLNWLVDPWSGLHSHILSHISEGDMRTCYIIHSLGMRDWFQYLSHSHDISACWSVNEHVQWKDEEKNVYLTSRECRKYGQERATGSVHITHYKLEDEVRWQRYGRLKVRFRWDLGIYLNYFFASNKIISIKRGHELAGLAMSTDRVAKHESIGWRAESSSKRSGTIADLWELVCLMGWGNESGSGKRRLVIITESHLVKDKWIVRWSLRLLQPWLRRRHVSEPGEWCSIWDTHRAFDQHLWPVSHNCGFIAI